MFLENYAEKQFECLSALDRNECGIWLKTIAGFANADGGVFYIGVEEETNELIGFDFEDAVNERECFIHQVYEHLSPVPEMRVSVVPYHVNGSDRFIIRVDVLSAFFKPVVMYYKRYAGIYMRREGFTDAAGREEIIRMSIQSQNTQYDSLVTDEVYSRDDFQDLLAFYREHNEGKELPDQALASLGFFDSEKHLTDAAVMFKDGYDGKKTSVVCSLYARNGHLVSSYEYSGNITGTIRFVSDFVETHMNHGIIKRKDSHIDVPAYPQRALFEGMINAVTHRDYDLDGTEIRVDLFKDRLEITSPGNFFQGENLDVTFDLSSVISKRRNELIAGVLAAWDTGFDKIVEEYNDADDTHKPYIFSKSQQFTLVLPDLTYEPGILNAKIRLEYAPAANGSSYDDAILSYCFTGPRRAAEIAAELDITNSTYFRNTILQNLVDQNYLKKGKEGRYTVYSTVRSSVRKA